ncbi:MAG: polysaccharide deacetylase [Ruminococcaceae bacterium]|nr:polysaccharide deacetylase [Oscillospiraceae bacterium]
MFLMKGFDFLKRIAITAIILILFLCGCNRTEDSLSSSDFSSSQIQQEIISSQQSLISSEVMSSEASSSSQTSSTPQSSQFSQYDNTKRDWGQGTNVNAQNQPLNCLNFAKQYGQYDAYFIAPSAPKKVYLTFDLGYENGYTEKIVNTLNEKNAIGVFFVTYDYYRASPHIVKKIVEDGHILGNHTKKHPSLPTVSEQRVIDEIMFVHDLIKQEYDYDMVFFRPPMGQFSHRSLKITQSLGYKSIFWSFAYKDWETDNQPDPVYAKNKIINAAHDGCIYLLHAVSKTNADILGDVIDGLRNKGFEIADLRELNGQ